MRFSMRGLAFPQCALWGGVSLLVGVVGCDASGPAGPRGPGALHFDLVSPNGPEGAALFEVTGGVGLEAATAQGGEVFHQTAGGTIHLVVLLDEPGQIRFQMRAENVRNLPTVRVVQVADGENELRSPLSGYDVHLLAVADGGSP